MCIVFFIVQEKRVKTVNHISQVPKIPKFTNIFSMFLVQKESTLNRQRKAENCDFFKFFLS